jgi:TM2 domain-containing membrane protein YozV
MSQQWFVTSAGRQYGPYSLDEFRTCLQQRRVSPTDMAWRQEMPDWQPIQSIPELREFLNAIPPEPSRLPPLPDDVSEDTELLNKKIPAGVLGIVLGGFGVHKFVLGYTKAGIIMLVVGFVGIFLVGIPTFVMGVIGLIEGIMYLSASDREFVQRHRNHGYPWF